MKPITKSVIEKLNEDYHNATRRILFIDFDGILLSFNELPELTTIDPFSLGIITKLTRDKRNRIVVISGRSKNFMDMQFKYIDITLVAENGFFIRKAGKDWVSTINSDLSRKDELKPVMMDYVKRCEGSYLEEKTGSLAWHYKNANDKKTMFLIHEFLKAFSNSFKDNKELEIIKGDKVLEVRIAGFNKGMAASVLLKNEDFDFIFAAGNDQTDEFIFKSLPVSAHTIRAGGETPSLAHYKVGDMTQLMQILEAMIKNATP